VSTLYKDWQRSKGAIKYLPFFFLHEEKYKLVDF